MRVSHSASVLSDSCYLRLCPTKASDCSSIWGSTLPVLGKMEFIHSPFSPLLLCVCVCDFVHCVRSSNTHVGSVEMFVDRVHVHHSDCLHRDTHGEQSAHGPVLIV